MTNRLRVFFGQCALIFLTGNASLDIYDIAQRLPATLSPAARLRVAAAHLSFFFAAAGPIALFRDWWVRKRTPAGGQSRGEVAGGADGARAVGGGGRKNDANGRGELPTRIAGGDEFADGAAAAGAAAAGAAAAGASAAGASTAGDNAGTTTAPGNLAVPTAHYGAAVKESISPSRSPVARVAAAGFFARTRSYPLDGSVLQLLAVAALRVHAFLLARAARVPALLGLAALQAFANFALFAAGSEAVFFEYNQNGNLFLCAFGAVWWAAALSARVLRGATAGTSALALDIAIFAVLGALAAAGATAHESAARARPPAPTDVAPDAVGEKMEGGARRFADQNERNGTRNNNGGNGCGNAGGDNPEKDDDGSSGAPLPRAAFVTTRDIIFGFLFALHLIRAKKILLEEPMRHACSGSGAGECRLLLSNTLPLAALCLLAWSCATGASARGSSRNIFSLSSYALIAVEIIRLMRMRSPPPADFLRNAEHLLLFAYLPSALLLPAAYYISSPKAELISAKAQSVLISAAGTASLLHGLIWPSKTFRAAVSLPGGGIELRDAGSVCTSASSDAPLVLLILLATGRVLQGVQAKRAAWTGGGGRRGRGGRRGTQWHPAPTGAPGGVAAGVAATPAGAPADFAARFIFHSPVVPPLLLFDAAVARRMARARRAQRQIWWAARAGTAAAPAAGADGSEGELRPAPSALLERSESLINKFDFK